MKERGRGERGEEREERAGERQDVRARVRDLTLTRFAPQKKASGRGRISNTRLSRNPAEREGRLFYGARQDLEAHLMEVMVGGQRLPEP